jgi:Secretory lipase
MALTSWSQVYDSSLDPIVAPGARPSVARIAERCLYDQSQILASVPGSLLLGLRFITTPPWEIEPWRTILAVNTPGTAPTRVPMIITQGDADPIMTPDVTSQFVAELCANGETVDYRILPGVAHLEAGHVAAPDVASWIADRFAGKPAPNTCSSTGSDTT